MPSPSPFSSSVFERLLYSQRGTGKNRDAQSLVRRSQELGAQLCGRLSQMSLEVNSAAFGGTATIAADVGAAARDADSPLAPSFSSPATAPLCFMEDVHRDLSAHYGSHAVRRGLAKPLGPCVHPVIRKGRFAAQSTGMHSPLYMRVWLLRLVRRCWCPRCGVWLTRGSTPTHTEVKASRTILATLKECRVRRQLRSSRHATTRGRFMLCCLRCLDTAQRAAKRHASLSEIATSEQQREQGADRNTAENVSLSTKRAAREARATRVERALKALLAEARVPRRNRRCRRRSQRRRRDSKEEARTGAKVAVRADSGNPAAVLQHSSSAYQVTHKLALSLVRKTTPLAGIAGSGNTTKTSAASLPTTARTAQKSLQGLVPSGPLKKSALRVSAMPPRQQSPKKLPATVSSACEVIPVTAEPAVVVSSTLRIPPPLPSSSINIGGAHAQITDWPVEAVQEKEMKAASRTPGTSSKNTPATTSDSAPKFPFTDSRPSCAPPGPHEPPRPAKAIASTLRTSNTPKRVACPPAKYASTTKKPTTAKKKLMDTMNQLGF
ncbi:hypothetical protein, conserved [Leishmania lindenbergi]|uniref:Uncharacterized protein n=1 Tax=Leishmania lindenbergi TaxID=651832 RepID=A0AAW3AY96_9TRYP